MHLFSALTALVALSSSLVAVQGLPSEEKEDRTLCRRDEWYYPERRWCLPRRVTGDSRSRDGKRCPEDWYWFKRKECCVPKREKHREPRCPRNYEWNEEFCEREFRDKREALPETAESEVESRDRDRHGGDRGRGGRFHEGHGNGGRHHRRDDKVDHAVSYEVDYSDRGGGHGGRYREGHGHGGRYRDSYRHGGRYRDSYRHGGRYREGHGRGGRYREGHGHYRRDDNMDHAVTYEVEYSDRGGHGGHNSEHGHGGRHHMSRRDDAMDHVANYDVVEAERGDRGRGDRHNGGRGHGDRHNEGHGHGGGRHMGRRDEVEEQPKGKGEKDKDEKCDKRRGRKCEGGRRRKCERKRKGKSPEKSEAEDMEKID